MSSQDAKTYLSKRNVPGLFECLMTGLMFHRPTDHIQYLIECLEKVKAKGQDELRWNMFIEMQRAKTPLPPITPSNGRRPMSRERSMTPKEERAPTPVATTAPLPPISDKSLPDVPIIFLMGGPGSGKSTQAELLLKKYPGWVTISIGDLLRSEVADKGSADEKWKMVNDLMSKGELVPEEVVQNLLISKMRSAPKAQGFIIQGFPRDMDQAKEYDRLVGRVDAVFLLDCEEETLSKQLLERGKKDGRLDNNVNTIAKRMQAYKDKTLPVLKHYDDMEKLFILEGEKSKEDIAEDLAVVFETVVGGKGSLSPAPPLHPKPERKKSPRSGRTTPKSPQKDTMPEPSAPPMSEADNEAPLPASVLPPEVKVKDEGRKPDLPKAPIIFFAGGPGSGKGTQCKRLMARYTNAVHLSMGDIIRTKITNEGTADAKWGMVTDLLRKGDLAPEEVTVELLMDNLKQHANAHFFIIEGFPRNLEQLEDFNKHIGGMSYTILLDCDEQSLHYRLSVRGKESERIDDNLVAIGKKLTFFKNTTLPILKTIEDDGKLVVIPGDRDEEEIYFDLCKVIDFSIYNKLPEVADATSGKEPVKEEVIEAAVVPAAAHTTGDNIANPAYSAELDALQTDEAQKPAESASEAPKSEDAPADESKTQEAKVESKQDDTAAKDKEKPVEAEPNTDGITPVLVTESAAVAVPKSEEKSEEPQEAAAEVTPKTASEAPSTEEAQQTEAPKAEEAAKTGEAAKPEEAAKIEVEAKTEAAAKTEEDASATEAPAPKTEAEPKPDEPSKTEETPKTEEEAKPEEASKTEDTPKIEEESKTEETLSAPEPKTEQAAEPEEYKPSDAAGDSKPSEAAVEPSSGDKDTTEATSSEENKDEKEEATARTDASEEETTEAAKEREDDTKADEPVT